GQIPTSRVGRSGCAVRSGRPRYACIESAETTSLPRRSATASATAVLPDAVGPKIATTLTGRNGRAGLPAKLGVLGEERVGGERIVLFRVRGSMIAKPGDGARDPLVERDRRLVSEQLPRLRQVGDVVRHLAEQRGRQGDLRFDAELRADELGRANKRVALAIREVDGLVPHSPVRQSLHSK